MVSKRDAGIETDLPEDFLCKLRANLQNESSIDITTVAGSVGVAVPLPV
jgi:hypothetical protein